MAEWIINWDNIYKPETEKLTQTQILNIFRKSLTYDLTRRLLYTQHELIFDKWLMLQDKDYWNHKIEFKFLTRFCKAHASYVFKWRPNIYVPPISPDIKEFRDVSNYTEKALNTWWDAQKVPNKLKQWVITASYKWDFVWFLSVNNDKQEVTFNKLQPDFFAYDTVTADPDSPYLWIMKWELVDVASLKKQFPSIAWTITPSWLNNRFMAYTNFYRSDLYNLEKALYVEIMDRKYLYRYINDIEIEVIEHNYPMIPYYHLRYFDFWKKYWEWLASLIKDPIKFLNQLLGYQMDSWLKVSNPPVVVTWWNPEVTPDWNKWWMIVIPTVWATISYLQPPMSNLQMDKLIEILKTFVHFLSWLSEEAMAWFTWALTAAWISIELRMDSTLREALDVQLNLQPIIEKINRDYIKLMKKFFPKKDLFDTEEFWKIFDIPFYPQYITSYLNTIDFWWVLPRSDTETVRNVLAKVQAQLISKDTALEEMRYKDPGIERNKIKWERIEEAKTQQEIQTWWAEKTFYDNPEEENQIMLTKNKLVIPHPAQNHEEHLLSHQKLYQSNQSPVLLQHIMMTQELMKSQNEISKMPTRSPDEMWWGNQWWFQQNNSFTNN